MGKVSLIFMFINLGRADGSKMIKLFQLIVYLVIHDVVTSTAIQSKNEMRSKMITLGDLLFPQPFPRRNKSKTCIENAYSRYHFIYFSYDLFKLGLPRQSYAGLEPCETKSHHTAQWSCFLWFSAFVGWIWVTKLSDQIASNCSDTKGQNEPTEEVHFQGQNWKVWFSNFMIKDY